jgi:hypothetical protein
MAQFKAEIQGNRGSVSRLGHKTTGIQGHVCGWDTGIKIEGHYDEELGDIFLVYQTAGSNRKHRDVLIGKLINGNFNSHYSE